MHKKKWSARTRYLLSKYKIDRKELANYRLDPYKWDRAIPFEIELFATDQRNRLYQMRTWQKRILELPDSMDWNKVNLLEILSNALCKKLKKNFNDPKLTDIYHNHYHSLAGYWAKRPTRRLLRYYSF